jgi:hypothetical protein
LPVSSRTRARKSSVRQSIATAEPLDRGPVTSRRRAVETDPDPVGFQKSASAGDLRRSFHAAGMITDVSRRLLYLIVDRFRGSSAG